MKYSNEKFHSVSLPLEISQNSQENTCARVSLIEHLRWLLLKIIIKFFIDRKETINLSETPFTNHYSHRSYLQYK